MGLRAELLDMPGGVPPPQDADCAIVVAPLNAAWDLRDFRAKRTVLIGSFPPDRGLLETYQSMLFPEETFVLDLREAPRWRLAQAASACVEA